MANIILPPRWQVRERDATERAAYQNRREFLASLGLGTIGLAASPSLVCTGRTGTGAPLETDGPLDTIPANAPRDGYPAVRNANYTVPERPTTDRLSASSYTNFYEFDGSSKEVWHLTKAYEPYPWTLEVGGLVEKDLTVDLSDLIRKFGIQERLYRFRCVEAWSVTVPWTGFPLSKLIEFCKPLSKATHVRFVSVKREDQMPGIKSQPWYPWPYFEGLRMDEAVHDLAFVVTGMYGEPLTKQNGSPLRLALPWKYGYKGPKAIQRIEFVDREPSTFWNQLAPDEYPFLSNVNPNVPHPRWSQASERFIRSLDNIERIPTQLLNGYAEFVGDLYPGIERG